jgi:hypothetical protein
MPPTDADGDRAARARTERMTVRPLRDGRYVVETDGGTYVVDLDDRDCTCPDHAIRGATCKHLRRVAIDVTEGRTPAPDRRAAACAVCGERAFVPFHDPGPTLCGRHDRRPGDLVRDRERGGWLVVTGAPGDRADDHRTGEGRLVADYATNARYGGHEPVVSAVYLDGLGPDRGLATARRYWFPVSRLVPVERRETTRPGSSRP